MFEFLLPQFPGLLLERVFNGFEITVLTLRSSQIGSNCPNCQTCSEKVHSYYTRHLQDLPLAQQQLRLVLKARRFYCHNQGCPKLTFAENFGQTIQAYARRTARCATTLTEIARLVGGQTGAELAQIVGIPASRDTLLRLLNKLAKPEVGTPKVVGVDDWAWKKGQRYGTIIVDLLQHRPLDLLPDRNSQSVANWLAQYPSIEIVSRDRGPVYIEGVRRGAPQARQVTDRWHLLKNLSEHLQKFLASKTNLIRQQTKQMHQAKIGKLPRGGAQNLKPTLGPMAAAPSSGRIYQVNTQRLAEYAERFERIHALRAQKLPIAHIARELNLSRMTIYKYLALKEPVGATPLPFEHSSLRGTRMLDPFGPYLLTRWQQGCRNATQLWQEIRVQGFNGSRRGVQAYIRSLRSQPAVPPPTHKAVTPLDDEQVQTLAELARERKLPNSAYQAVWLFTRNHQQLKDWERQWLVELCEADEKIALTYSQAQLFVKMVREHNSQPLSQ